MRYLILILVLLAMLLVAGCAPNITVSGNVTALRYNYVGFGTVDNTTVYFSNNCAITVDGQLALTPGRVYTFTLGQERKGERKLINVEAQ